jgi:hypothetical protein
MCRNKIHRFKYVYGNIYNCTSISTAKFSKYLTVELKKKKSILNEFLQVT